MSTVSTLARSYEALRPRVLERVLELRATLDPSLGRLDDTTARAQIGAVLDHLGNFIATGDLALHRGFLHTFLAMRAAEAQSPASVLAMLVAIGDTAAQVAQDEGAGTTVADGAGNGNNGTVGVGATVGLDDGSVEAHRAPPLDLDERPVYGLYGAGNARPRLSASSFIKSDIK